MIKKIFILIVVSLLFSCYTIEKADEWAKSNKGNTNININGMWSSDEWGYAEFDQNYKSYNYVTGKIGEYKFYGYINNKKVYLIFPRSTDRVNYTMILELVDENILQGKYYEGNIEKNIDKAYIIILKRVNPKKEVKKESKTNYKTKDFVLE